MSLIRPVLFSLVLFSCFALYSSQAQPTPCLYSSASSKILLPLQLLANKCPNNKTYCMNVIYNYANFQYNGQAGLKPNKGEVVLFLAKYPDAAGTYHLVTMLNANITTTMNVTMSMTGTAPANIELYDDPATALDTSDKWQWDSSTNTGHFTWKTQPTFTDGCIIGPITFVDNYCIKAIFNQPNNAIQTISVMSGNSSSPMRIITLPYTSGSTFEFCQYPQTATVTKDVTCPGLSNGNASVSIVHGPTTGLQYIWYASNGAVIGHSSSISNLAAGNYTVYVNDTSLNGCDATRKVVINDGPKLYAAAVTTTPFACSTKGTAAATPVGGSGGFSYQWMQGATVIGTGASIDNLNVGSYSLKVTDSCGSTATTPFNISTTGCCGDGICQSKEVCGGSSFCAADCGACCAPGLYSSNGACVVCPAGTTANTWGATSCASCPVNSFNAGGNESCMPCPANTYSSAGSGVCTSCPKGQIRPTDKASCASCGSGNVPVCGSATCSSCASGTYALAGWSSCQACPAGTISSGGSSCVPCPAGTYAAAGSPSCSSCPSGTTSAAGSSHVMNCA